MSAISLNTDRSVQQIPPTETKEWGTRSVSSLKDLQKPLICLAFAIGAFAAFLLQLYPVALACGAIAFGCYCYTLLPSQQPPRASYDIQVEFRKETREIPEN